MAQLLAEARDAITEIDMPAAQEMIAGEDALLLDVREADELERKGIAKGAHHVPRGILEFVVDPASPFFDPRFRFDRPVILYCAGGWRAALAGKLLQDMGYARVFSIGSLNAWQEGGGEIDIWRAG